MLTLIGDLLINEYFQDGYQLRVSTFRHSGQVASIVVDSDFLGESASQVYYGKIARDLYRVLMLGKLSQTLGGTEKLNLGEFMFCGVTIKSSKENN